MNLIILVISIAWLFRIISNVFSYVHLWRVKEYRLDRMLIHLKTDQGKRILFLPLRIPLITPKTILLILLSLATLAWVYTYSIFHPLVTLIFLDLLTIPIVSIWVGILRIPTAMYHLYTIKLASERLREHKPMIVIGITGSYGKTSTKEFLATILSAKFKVLKTEMSKNSPIGIAEAINKNLKSDHEVFIVEMGAYKIGEISQMCELVRPQIGIVTAINEQHQDLFGSIENTMKAKYELVAGLTGKQVALFNADYSYTQQMADWAHKDKKNVAFFSQKNTKLPTWAKTNIKADDIKFFADKIGFRAVIGKQSALTTVSVLGEHQVSNILAAMLAAQYCGLTLKQAALAASNIHSFTKTMEIVPGIPGATFINDTFNNNPDAAEAAINYLSHLKGKRILVFQPMIELGSFAEAAHTKIGKIAAKICTDILLTNSNYYESFVSGLSEKQKQKIHIVTPEQGAYFIKHHIEKGDAVLFKGKEAENILQVFNKNH